MITDHSQSVVLTLQKFAGWYELNISFIVPPFVGATNGTIMNYQTIPLCTSNFLQFLCEDLHLVIFFLLHRDPMGGILKMPCQC